MKLFRKKTIPPAESKPRSSASPHIDYFYTRPTGEAPLDEYAHSGAQYRRTTRHSPGQVRERSNRASSWAIAGLLFKAVLIVVLLVGGYLGLRWGLGLLAEPTEKDQQRWEKNAEKMEKTKGSDTAPAVAAVPQELVVSPELIGQRLDQWEKTQRHLRSAEALSRRGIHDEAIQRLGQALRITPDCREAQQMLVELYMKQGVYAEAVPLCIRLLDQDSRQPELQMNLLRALQASGQIAAGLVLADRLLREQPNNQEALSIVASGQIAQGHQEEALAIFERILAHDPKNKGALENCGEIHLEQKAYDRAVPYYLELIRHDSKPAWYQAAALCYARQNDAGKSVVLMGQASSLFGGGTVSPWLKDPGFDPIRESVEFRSFADRIVGVETRKAIEELSKREAEKTTPEAQDGGLGLPKQPDLDVLRPK